MCPKCSDVTTNTPTYVVGLQKKRFFHTTVHTQNIILTPLMLLPDLQLPSSRG